MKHSSQDDDGPTLEDLEAFHDRLQGPLGQALRATGVVIDRKLRERGLTLDRLADTDVVELFNTAFAEAAAQARLSRRPLTLFP